MTSKDQVPSDDDVVRVSPSQVTIFEGATPSERVQAMFEGAALVPRLLSAPDTTANIEGKRYITVDGWCAIGHVYGVVPLILDVVEVKAGVHRATCQVMHNGIEVARVFNECSMAERTKYDKPRWSSEQACMSMAQTRAIGKGMRFVLSSLVALAEADYQLTPADEVPDGGFGDRDQQQAQRGRQQGGQNLRPQGGGRQGQQQRQQRGTLKQLVEAIAKRKQWASATEDEEWKMIALENAKVLATVNRGKEVEGCAISSSSWQDMADRLSQLFGENEDRIAEELAREAYTPVGDEQTQPGGAAVVDESTGEIIGDVEPLDEDIEGQVLPDDAP